MLEKSFKDLEDRKMAEIIEIQLNRIFNYQENFKSVIFNFSVMNLLFMSYRFGYEVLESSEYKELKREMLDILKNAPVPKLAKPKIRKREGRTRIFTTDQKALNSYFDKEFEKKGWDVHPAIVPGKGTRLYADYRKRGVQIEVQFGNMARWYGDIFKFQLSYSLGIIEVGVSCVPTLKFAKTIDENVAYFERVCRELPHAKMSITLPILVIGMEP